MIKIDYEGAWKEFKRKYGVELYLRKKHYNIFLYSFMNDMEQKHTHDYIDIRRRSDKEIADYCLEKYVGQEQRITKLEKDNIIFSNELYGEITLKQLIKKLLSTLGLIIETSHIPAKEEIKEFELKGNKL